MLSTGVIVILAISILLLREVTEPIPLSTFTCDGFNDIALSGSVDYTSNDPTLNTNAWLLTVVQNCQGRYAIGTIQKEDIVDGDKQAEKDFKIEFSLDKQACEYPINVMGTPVYVMNQETRYIDPMNANSLDIVNAWKSECQNKLGYRYFVQTGHPYYQYSCFWETGGTAHGVLGTPFLDFESTITLEVDGNSIDSQTITNTGAGSATIGNIGYAYWSGNLVTGEQCPIASDERIDALYQSGIWKTIDTLKYNDYLNYRSSGFENCLSRYVDYGTETAISCINAYNTYSSQATVLKQLTSSGGTVAETTGDAIDGQVILELSKIIQYPLVSMKISANWLGIYVPVGEPEIIRVYTEPFATGTTGIVTAEVRNVGDAYGAFKAYIDCPSPISQYGASRDVGIYPDRIGYVSVEVTGLASTEDITKTCTFHVYDMNNPTVEDTETIAVTVKPQITCSPYELRCLGNYIEQCNTQGTYFEQIEYCEGGCTIVNGVPTCSGVPTPPPDEEGDIPAWLWGALGVGLAAFAFVGKIYADKKKKGNRRMR